ncbi:GAF domain-containing protein [Streptomyces sp. LX-29]|uniref:helix-turn-helix domain-containing protein n=1 Tax=Streptomyces sp. LX-29 TaxID=2900152 RepID=UPI00240E7741|nr:helix-turn-helix domain-containing protein [Streptomyces sp. LX-29]WFB06879.1 GAF domain-containing protein [Streptomyces sp. LX-29]
MHPRTADPVSFPAPATARPMIAESWLRSLRHGVDPDVGRPARPLSTDQIVTRRQGSPLAELMPVVREGLRAVLEDERHVLLVTDAQGWVLWQEGSRQLRRSAERLELAEGAYWGEESAGTNGIAAALATRRPERVHAEEHYVTALRTLDCAAAPLHDPRDGRLLGVVNVTSPASLAHPSTLALVTAITRVAEGELRARHWESVNRLRSIAAPVLARLDGAALAVDASGWPAAATGMVPPDRVPLPRSPQAGTVWLPSLGSCTMEPLPGGWLVRVGTQGPTVPSRVVLDVTGARSWTVTVGGAVGSWSHELSPRHTELLLVLALHPDGRSAAQLAQDLFGDPRRVVTVRAEMSRLRRTVGGVLAHRPYRFADNVSVEVLRPDHPADLLPASTAPAVVAARRDWVGT